MAVGEETVAWVPQTGALHLLGPVATSVFELCDGRHDVASLTQKLSSRYAIEDSEICGDIQRLLGDLTGWQVLDAG